MHHALILTSRIVAGIVAAVAFYFAFFLYENEEGVWQNRIENLWAAIDDRAKVTNSTSIALFNKIGEVLNEAFDRLLGERLVSFYALAVLFDLSLCGAIVRGAWLRVAHRTSSPSYTAFIVVLLAFGTLTIVTIYFRHPLATLLGSLPVVGIVFLWLAMTFSSHKMDSRGSWLFFEMLSIVLLSSATDLLVITVVRRVLRMIAQTLSRWGFFGVVSIWLATTGVCAYQPLFEFGESTKRVVATDILWAVGSFNLTTAAWMCQIPALTLCVVLLHKWIWPVLGRLVYPIASRRIITNRKLLVPVGSLCLLYATAPSGIGLKDVVKLFS